MSVPSDFLKQRGFVLQADGSYSKGAGQAPALDTAPKPWQEPLLNTIVKESKDVEKLNQLERDWYAVMQDMRFAWIGVQNITLKLADRTRYTPDFSAVTTAGQFVFYETKGYMRDDANVKLKTAARLFPWAKFILVTRVDGKWDEKEINT